MTNTEIARRICKEGDLTEAFKGLDYYDALRLVSQITSVINDDKLDFNEDVIKNLQSIVNCDKIDRSIRYWLVKNIVMLSCENSALSKPYSIYDTRGKAILEGTKACDLVKAYILPDTIPKDATLDDYLKHCAIRTYGYKNKTHLYGDERDADALMKWKEELMRNPHMTENYQRLIKDED